MSYNKDNTGGIFLAGMVLGAMLGTLAGLILSYALIRTPDEICNMDCETRGYEAGVFFDNAERCGCLE